MTMQAGRQRVMDSYSSGSTPPTTVLDSAITELFAAGLTVMERLERPHVRDCDRERLCSALENIKQAIATLRRAADDGCS